MLNVNKLFPRLSIRVKLAIAFALVALVPLAVISALGARETVLQIQAKARNTLEHDLQMAEAQTAQSLQSAESHTELIATVVLGPLLLNAWVGEREQLEAERIVQTLLATEPTLYQIKLIDADGRYRLLIRNSGPASQYDDVDGGEYYAWRARSLKPRTRLLFAIEVAGPEEGGVRKPTPAIAILVPIYGADGAFRGVTVGETYASALFAHLDRSSPGFTGVTALVDEGGHFLYHSVRKRNWATLLAARDRLTVRSDFPDSIVAILLSRRAGTVVTPAQQLVSYRPLAVGTSFGAALTLYRAVPLAALTAPARSFLLLVLLAAALVTLIVIALAILAADQLTKPILRIRDAAWQLARGEPVAELNVATNDELEDLARDFALVADQVSRHHAEREAILAERTRILEQTHAELTDILKHSADAIIGVDPDGVVRIWNDGAERLFGRPADAAIGALIETVFQPSGERARRELGALRRELEHDRAVVNFGTEVLANDGTPIQISLTQTMIVGVDGRPLGSSLIVSDTRLQSRLEDQMRRSERLAAISVMAAGLAHEINNPLAVVANRIECMQRDLRDGDERGSSSLPADLDVLQQHVTRLRELTQSLLRFARDDYSEERPVALDALAKTVVMLLRRTMAARRIQLVFSAEAGLPPVIGYEKGIETVLVNLLLNAADATPPDGTVALTIRRRSNDEGVEIEVRDTGPGIPLALRERVFDPFYTSKKPGEGTGLGLTVCRTIIDRHGGSIRIDSPPDGGCRFVVGIPLQPVEAMWPEHVYS